MYFTVKQPWGMQKPVLGSQIDWSHPLARGFKLCMLFNEGAGVPQNLVAQRAIPQDVLAWRGGWASRNSITGVNLTAKAVEGTFPLTPPYTIIARTAINKTGNANLLVASDNSIGSCLLSKVESGITSAAHYVGGWKYMSVTPPAVGTPYTLAGVWGPTAQGVYYNGKPGPTRSDAYTLATGYLTLGAWMNGCDTWDGPAEYIYVIDRALSAAEIAWLYAEPYAMIQAPEMPVFYSIPAGGSSIAAISQYYARMRAA